MLKNLILEFLAIVLHYLLNPATIPSQRTPTATIPARITFGYAPQVSVLRQGEQA